MKTDQQLWDIYEEGHQQDGVRYTQARRHLHNDGRIEALTWVLERCKLSPATADQLADERDAIRKGER